MKNLKNDTVKALENALKAGDQKAVATISLALANKLASLAMAQEDPKEVKTVIDDKPNKPAKLMMEWPTALTALASDEESHADEAHSLQQLLASVFDGLWV